ncbi:hypothetical protein FKM82_014678 [Ascaphus truei]
MELQLKYKKISLKWLINPQHFSCNMPPLTDFVLRPHSKTSNHPHYSSCCQHTLNLNNRVALYRMIVLFMCIDHCFFLYIYCWFVLLGTKSVSL